MIATASAHHNAVYPDETETASGRLAPSHSKTPAHPANAAQSAKRTQEISTAPPRSRNHKGVESNIATAAVTSQHFAPATVVSDEQNLRVFSATPDARARTCARGRGRAIELREGHP